MPISNSETFQIQHFNSEHYESTVTVLTNLKRTGIDYPPAIDVQTTRDSLGIWLNDDSFLARWVVVNGDTVIGHIALAFPHDYLLNHLSSQNYSSDGEKGFIEIGKFFVDPAYQQHGIGHLLFKHALQYAAEKSYQPALAVVETSYAAIKFYKNIGMQDVGSFQGRHGKNFIFVQPS